MTQMHTFTMTEAEARLIHQMAADRMAAHKNWIVSAVERGDLAYAQLLAKDLRAHQAIFASFNMSAKLETAAAKGEPPATIHAVRAVR